MNELSNEVHQYLHLLTQTDDPVYYSLLFVIILFILLILIFNYIIFPLRKKYLLETHALELKNTRLMALFAELDPDPVIRIDYKGRIIFSNDSAKHLIKENVLEGRLISEIINNIDFSVANYISRDQSKSLIYKNDSNYYSVLFRGISSLQIAQIYFHDITEKVVYENKLINLSNNLQNSIEEERQRIARELHDGIGQNLLLLKMNLINNNRNVSTKPEMNIALQDSLDLLHNTIHELKNIIYGLKPSILEEMGLGPAIASLINKISDESSIQGNLKITGLEQRLDKKVELSIYRIIQEALNNIIKHSDASSFFIQLDNFGNKIKILVSDNGKGISNYNNNNKGFGLLNIQERVKSFNGSFMIGPQIENGTYLKIDIPLGQEK